MKEADEIIAWLKSQINEENRKGMSRFGINIDNAFGITMPILREHARKFKNNQELAIELWKSGYHEARILATLIADPKQCSKELMESWVVDFNSWDVCDQCCSNFFKKNILAYGKALEWAEREEEYVKRAGFTLMACLAVGDKKAKDEAFESFFDAIEKHSNDSRNFVRKAVNWALRQIGKRNKNLYPKALKLAEKLMNSDNKTAQWIGKDAFKEFCKESIRNRVIEKA